MKNNIGHIRSNPNSTFFGLLVKKIEKGNTQINFTFNASHVSMGGWGFVLFERKNYKNLSRTLIKENESLRMSNKRLVNAQLDLEDDLVTLANIDLPNAEDVNLAVLEDIREEFFKLLDKHGIDTHLPYPEDEGDIENEENED